MDQVPTHVTRTLAGVEALHLFLVDGEPAGMYVDFKFPSLELGDTEAIVRNRGSYEVEDGSGPGYLILADRERGIVRIHSLFVLRAYQGTGLGNEVGQKLTSTDGEELISYQILDFLEGECFKKGAKVITIDTLSTQIRTVDWYRRRGYRDFEVRRGGRSICCVSLSD